jgi:hypothetical protein
MSNELSIAAYETQRVLVLNVYANTPQLVPNAMAFAYQHRLAPTRHSASLREAHGLNPLEAFYPVKAQPMESVISLVDEKWRAEDFDAIAFERLGQRSPAHTQRSSCTIMVSTASTGSEGPFDRLD